MIDGLIKMQTCWLRKAFELLSRPQNVMGALHSAKQVLDNSRICLLNSILTYGMLDVL